MYSSVISIPIYWNPFCLAATSVEPEPANGSNTTPPGLVTILIRYSHNATVFTVGCLLPRMKCFCYLSGNLLYCSCDICIYLFYIIFNFFICYS